MKTMTTCPDAFDASDSRRSAQSSLNQTVEHVAHEVARRIQPTRGASGFASGAGAGAGAGAGTGTGTGTGAGPEVERELADPEGLLALLHACPDETLPAALGTVVVLAEVAEKSARRNLSQALMDIAASMLPRFQALVAAGIVSMDALKWPQGHGVLG